MREHRVQTVLFRLRNGDIRLFACAPRKAIDSLREEAVWYSTRAATGREAKANALWRRRFDAGLVSGDAAMRAIGPKAFDTTEEIK